MFQGNKSPIFLPFSLSRSLILPRLRLLRRLVAGCFKQHVFYVNVIGCLQNQLPFYKYSHEIYCSQINVYFSRINVFFWS